jgi:DNA-binding MarR family transcriptional regulator
MGATLDLDRYVPYLLVSVANTLSRGASRLYLRHFGVGINEWRVLSMIAVEPGVIALRICTVIGLDKAAASRSLKTLEGMGLIVSPDPAEQRSRGYRLTEKGEALHGRMLKVARQREERLLAGLSADERETLLALLKKMQAAMPAVNRDDYDIPE